MGPISTGLGEIYMWTVDAKPGAKKADGSDYTPTDLREIQDWVIKPQLRNVPGVVEVNSIGGFEKQYHVTPDPRKLVAYGLSFHDVMEALAKNNANVGAGYIERNGEQYLIRAPGQVRDMAEIRAHRRREPQRIARSHRRCGGGRDWAGTAQRRGPAQRPRVRARHDLHADGREQPHRLASRRTSG